MEPFPIEIMNRRIAQNLRLLTGIPIPSGMIWRLAREDSRP